MRKIELSDWLQFAHSYFADLKGKDIFDDEVRQEVNRRIAELSNLEKVLFQSGQLEEPPDDFNESYRQLIEANRKLGWKVPTGKQLEKTKARVKGFCQGKGAFVIYNEGDEQQAIKAVKDLAKERGFSIKRIERVEPSN